MQTRTPLGNLIRASLDAHGWSARKVEELAGGTSGLGRGNLTKLMNQHLLSIKGETLMSLAEVLGLPVELVVRAALRSLKTPIDLTQDAGTPEDAIRIDPDLTQPDKHTLLRMLEVMRTEAGGTRGNTTPMNQAGTAGRVPDPDKIARGWDTATDEPDQYLQAEGVPANVVPGGLDRLVQDPRVQEVIREQMRQDQDPRMGTPDDAITEGEDDYVAPPPGYEYDLAADESPSEGINRQHELDESEGS